MSDFAKFLVCLAVLVITAMIVDEVCQAWRDVTAMECGYIQATDGGWILITEEDLLGDQ